MQSILLTILFLISASTVIAQNVDPQYIFVRKDTDSCNPTDCSQLWNMNNQSRINATAVNDIIDKIGTRGNSSGTRKVGVGVLVFYNRYDIANIEQSIDNLLVTSQITDIPIFISLDGFQWWDKYPEIWNWWNPSAVGYNPNNINNVEWTCADSSCAINMSWRNWGSEFLTKPHPNLASPTFINHQKTILGILIPKITNWYKQLPADKKWLFGGVSLEVEADIGGNYYYYPNGINPNTPNPGPGIAKSTQLGFAAIKSLGLAGGITQSNLNAVIKYYLDSLDQFAYDQGIPRNKIFNHVGGTDLYPGWVNKPNLVFQNSSSAITQFGNPGWSFYGDITSNPQNYPGLTNALNQIGNIEWASPEWLTDASNYTNWVTSLRNSLNFRNNRFINIANWEGMARDKQYVLDAIKTVANEAPSCWVTSPSIDSINTSNLSTVFNWQKGSNNNSIHLYISNKNEFNTSGILNVLNISNLLVTNVSTATFNYLKNGQYYWQLVADGCSNQRKIINGSFEITISPTITPTPIASLGDYNHDGTVDLVDFSIWKTKYLAGQATLVDFTVWKSAYLSR